MSFQVLFETIFEDSRKGRCWLTVVVKKAPQSCNIIPILKNMKLFKMWIGLNRATELNLSKRNQSLSNK